MSRVLRDDLFSRVLRARTRIDDDYAQPLRLDELAREAEMSRFHFLRVFRETFGDTPGRYQSRVRIARAKELLARGCSVTETCFDVGFESLGSFSTRFTRDVRESPRAFQRSVRSLVAVPDAVAVVRVPWCFVAAWASDLGSRV